MGSLTRSGATCPQCHMPVHLRRDGSMADHKTDKLTVTGLPGRRTKQACPYSGVTPEEAKAGKTRVAKRREQHQAKQAAGKTQVQRERDGLPVELQRKPAKKTARPTGPDKLTVEVVIHRDRGQCAWCGGRITGERSIDWSVGHRRPRRMGGDPRPDTNSPANLILLHGDGVRSCHGALESSRAIAYDRGMLLHDGDTPSQRPIEHAVHGRVYLTDDGAISAVRPERAA